MKSAAPAHFFVRFCSVHKRPAAHRSKRTRRFCAERETKESAAGFVWRGKQKKARRVFRGEKKPDAADGRALRIFTQRALFVPGRCFSSRSCLRGRESAARFFCFHAFYPHAFSRAAAFSLRPRLRGRESSVWLFSFSRVFSCVLPRAPCVRFLHGAEAGRGGQARFAHFYPERLFCPRAAACLYPMLGGTFLCGGKRNARGGVFVLLKE